MDRKKSVPTMNPQSFHPVRFTSNNRNFTEIPIRPALADDKMKSNINTAREQINTLKNCNELIERSQQYGIDSLQNLETQKQQLLNINISGDNIDGKISHSHKIINRISKNAKQYCIKGCGIFIIMILVLVIILKLTKTI